MSGFLRLAGIINAAIWLGAGLFFAAVVLPGVFSEELHTLFHETPDNTYYTGAVAMLLFRRFFIMQYICGIIALLHLFAEKFYQGRPFPRIGGGLVIAMLSFYLLGGLWLQPKMEGLRHTRYFGQTQEQKDKARHAFGVWHGISLGVDFLMLGGLLVHLIRISQPAGPARYGNFYQIPV